MASHAFDLCVRAPRSDGGRVTYIQNAGSNVLTLNFASPTELPKGTSDLLAFLDHFDTDPLIKEHLPEARREMGKVFEELDGISLRTLRMRKGLSQVELSDALGTSQAAISEIENRIRKPGEDSIRGLARILEVDFNTLMDALNHG